MLEEMEENPGYTLMLVGGLTAAGGIAGHLLGGLNICTLVTDLSSRKPTAEELAIVEDCKASSAARARTMMFSGAVLGLATGFAALAWQSK